MGEPKLYERYDHQEAIARFGSEAEARSLCDGQWVIFPNVVLCFAVVGEPPRKSHFRNAGQFCWVADKPYRVSDDQHYKFVPREVIGGQAGGRMIYLFVRPEGSERYLYVGKLGPAHCYGFSGHGSLGEAYFDLRPVLPSEVWIELGGLRPA